MIGHTIIWVPQFLAGLTSILVAFYLWRRRSTPAAKTLLILMAATAEWAFLSALHKVSPDLSTKILIAKMQYIGIVTVPPALLVFVLQYTGRERWLTNRNLILLTILPVITLGLAWTNEFHKLIWERTWIDFSGSIPIGVYDYGPFFWIWTSFCYLAILLSTIWLIQAFISSPRLYRIQVLIMLIGIAAPWVANGLYLFNISPWPRIDLTPIAFTITGLALGCGMFWVRILDIVPVAHATVLKGIPDGVIVLDDNKRIVNMNPAAQKILSLPNSGVIGQSALEIFANQPTLIEYLRDVTEVRSEITLGQGDTQRYYDLYISPFKDRQGSLIGRLITLRDFTQRKLSEMALRESENKYRVTFESIPDSITITRVEDGCYFYVNDGFCHMTGYSKEEAVGKTPFDLNLLVNSFDRDEFIRILKEEGEVNGVELQYRRKEGTLFDTLFSARPLLYGKEDCLVAVVKDITSIKKTEREKLELQKQLQQAQKMEAMGTLSGGIAHDFNNLLMGIQGRTSLLRMGKDSSHPDYRHLKGIEESVKSAADLTRQLLGFARGGKYEVTPTNLNNLLKKSSEMFGRTRKEIKRHEKYQEDIWTLEVDGGQMEQVLLNLFVNAWHAMPGGGDLFIETENVTVDESFIRPFEVQLGKYVKISITDTGVGMDEATRQRIFEPFFTTRKMGRGTGLGLASVYGIIKNHGGFIDVYSERGHGTTFDIYLPASEKVVMKEKTLTGIIIKGSESILLVDDEDVVIDVGKELLEELGYEVLLARSGREAIEIYKKNKKKMDMVILDMIMPDMSGGDTYDRLKEINPDIKVLLSSGYSIDGQATEILNRGCEGFIQKPFDIKQLSQKLREILDKE